MSILPLATRQRGRAGAAIASETALLRLDGISKVWGGRDGLHALDRVDLEVARGEFLCLVGASGCGKSTLLSIVAGLERATGGHVENAAGHTALMFQEPALLPWLTALRNVELPLRLAGVGAAERRERAMSLLETVHLARYAHRRPHELSGGMRQRVALARALAQRADLLLMDEPFAALDAITRDVLHEDIVRLHQATGLTVVFVTHNVREAVRLGDRVVLMSSRPGRVLREFPVDIAHPRRIEDAPVGALAAQITGHLRTEVGRHGR